MKKCSFPTCPNTFSDHRWGRIKAQALGWFFPRTDNDAWCPEHIPDWVTEWRKSKEQDRDVSQ